ncbi:uncharacterized protein LOC102807973 [Saccoglossus kowalevskii]
MANIGVQTAIFVVAAFIIHASHSDDCEDSRPQVWLGYATSECDLSEEYCDLFSLDYVCSDVYKDGDSCLEEPGGRPGPLPLSELQNVLCASPSGSTWQATPATTINVITYNIWELRLFIGQQNGQIERTCRIPQHIFRYYGDVDAIVFNEGHMGGCFSQDGISMRQILEQYGFPYYTKTLGVGKLPSMGRFENGGVFIASRWPIVAEQEHVFRNALRLTSDALNAKGVMYAKIEKSVNDETKYYHVFGTHMQSTENEDGDEIRALQAKEIHAFMLEQNILKSDPVIYAGDFNSDYYGDRWEQILEILRARMPQITGPINVTYDYQHNDVFDEGLTTPSLWIDYVLYSEDHLMPCNASQEAIKFVDEQPFWVCMDGRILQPGHAYPYQSSCRSSKNITDLSDHYAVLGRLDFSSSVMPTSDSGFPTLPAECIVGDRPSVWLGRVTAECNLTPDYCRMFGMEFICSSDFEVWDRCYSLSGTGQNVLCAIPEVAVTQPTPLLTFKVMNYNIWGLRYLIYQTGQYERTCRMLPNIMTHNGDVDVIVFNEAFMGGCFHMHGASFRDILKYYGFRYFTGTVGENTSLLPQPENGGVFIASRWPITAWEETIYEDYVIISSDMLSSKGAMYAAIEKTVDGQTVQYHVLGTHLQAGQRSNGGSEVRLAQVEQMHDLMLSQDIPQNEPVIYAGDYNTDMYTEQDELVKILEVLEATVPPVVGPLKYTNDKQHNDIIGPSNETSKWIDYVMYSYAHLNPDDSSMQAFNYTDDPYTVCMDEFALFSRHLYPYDERCGENKTITDLSNHYAVIGTFSFSQTTSVGRRNTFVLDVFQIMLCMFVYGVIK